jgi:hypothetical protein
MVKSDVLVVAAGTSEHIVVDLGVAIDEVVRILGVQLCVDNEAPFAIATAIASLSFDPEDVAVALDDDEQFVHVRQVSAFTTEGGQKMSENLVADYSNMNLLTTRNLAFVASAVGAQAIAVSHVYYERYKPTKDDLVMLIAQRR